MRLCNQKLYCCSVGFIKNSICSETINKSQIEPEKSVHTQIDSKESIILNGSLILSFQDEDIPKSPYIAHIMPKGNDFQPELVSEEATSFFATFFSHAFSFSFFC